jgi:hypothetical protein
MLDGPGFGAPRASPFSGGPILPPTPFTMWQAPQKFFWKSAAPSAANAGAVSTHIAVIRRQRQHQPLPDR